MKIFKSKEIVLMFLGIIFGMLVFIPCVVMADSWSNTGSMSTGRCYHSTTLLNNGKVLVAGGMGSSGYLSSAELYDPASGTWTPAGSMIKARGLHTATLLNNGKVLVIGGANAFDSAEIYDPDTNSWGSAAKMAANRAYNTATLLNNGKVLVTGGLINGGTPAAEIYDPSTNSWSKAGNMSIGTRNNHTATLLNNGKVLVAGGGTSVAEIYDPDTNSWSNAGNMVVQRVSGHTATLLNNNKVLVAGGNLNGGISVSSAEIYDPETNSWSSTGSMLAERALHIAVLLNNRNVLVFEGSSGNNSAELYDVATNKWKATVNMNAARGAQSTAVLLNNGKVLAAGGNSSGYLLSAELYNSPPRIPTGLTATVASGSQISLSWSAAGGATGYKIYRNSICINSAWTATTYSDSGLSCGTSYSYYITAYNAEGDGSTSSTVSATTLPNAPSSPSGLTATAASQTQINLSWSTSSGATGYTIYRNGSQATTTTSNSYNDTGLAVNTTYSYYVTASNAGGTSGTSNTASATTLPNPPSAPTGLTAAVVSSTQINLNWSATSGATGYKIYRGGSYITSCTDTMYSCTGLSPSTSYSYYIKAYNAGGDSAASSTVTANTPASVPTVSGLTAEDIKRLVKEALGESSAISGIKTSSDGAYNILNGSSNGGNSFNSMYALVNESRNALRKKAIKVINGVVFTEVVYDELNNGTNNGVTATPSIAGYGYTVLTGTITSSGIQIATFTSKTDGQSRGIIFNVIEKPTLNTVATVNFIE